MDEELQEVRLCSINVQTPSILSLDMCGERRNKLKDEVLNLINQQERWFETINIFNTFLNEITNRQLVEKQQTVV